MKRKLILALSALLVMTNANALIVSVDGHGDINAEEMQIEVTGADEDPLTGERVFKVSGTLLCTENLSVQITRSEGGIADEFCCAGQCTSGNKSQEETLQFAPNGVANWYAHVTAKAGVPTDLTVQYRFTQGTTETKVLKVHYSLTAEGIEEVQWEKVQSMKMFKGGQVVILRQDNAYSVQGTIIE